MPTIAHLNAEFAKLKMLRGRTPQTTAAEREESQSLARLMPYRDGAIFIAKFAGSGLWERHPEGEEIIQIVDGTATLHVIGDSGPEDFNLSAGAFVIIPEGVWHRFESADGVSLITVTPQPSDFATVDDPALLLVTPGSADRVGS
jgi:mannose-6-phosphate isomerase-like protein (cupin superfamily)